MLLTASRAASCSSMIRLEERVARASPRVRRCHDPPNPLMRWRMCRKNPSRCCSPLLPMSTPASACLATILRNAALPEPVELGRVDRFAAGAADMKPGQLRRARQAAGMGRQNPLIAAAHRRSSQEDREGLPNLARKCRLARPCAIANKPLACPAPSSIGAGHSAQQLKGGDPVSGHKPRSSAAVTRIPTCLEIRA